MPALRHARLLDLLIRLGPYGDGFGRSPDGLTLARVAEHEHGLDLGPLESALPAKLATASGRIELAPPRILDDLPGVRLGVASLSPGVNANRLLAARDVDAPSGASMLNGVPVSVEATGRES